MKRTYKLYGTVWDNKPITYGIKLKLQTDLQIIECISLKEVLKCEKLLERKYTGEATELLLDYIPDTDSHLVWDYYLKRVLQIANYYEVKSFICETKEGIDRMEMLLTDYYKRKAPNKLLAQSDGANQVIC